MFLTCALSIDLFHKDALLSVVTVDMFSVRLILLFFCFHLPIQMFYALTEQAHSFGVLTVEQYEAWATQVVAILHYRADISRVTGRIRQVHSSFSSPPNSAAIAHLLCNHSPHSVSDISLPASRDSPSELPFGSPRHSVQDPVTCCNPPHFILARQL